MNSGAMPADDEAARYGVVANRSGQVGLWPLGDGLPDGWSPTGTEGSRAECLEALTAQVKPLIGPDWGCPDRSGCPHGPSVLDVFADSVRRFGTRAAVRSGDRILTYAELDRAAESLAAALNAQGVGREDAVAVRLPRGVDVFVAMLGILKSGAAYVPIDPRLPGHRQDEMVTASGAVLTLTPEVLAGLLDATPAGATRAAPAACQAASVLFTSGSSGRPKAIVLEHRNIVYLAKNDALPELRPEDRVAHVSSLSFDAFHFETWCALAAGAEIVVMPTLPELMSGDVQRELRRQRVTVMLAPTMAVNHLVAEDRDTFSGLRVLHTGGDVVLPAACRHLLDGSFSGTFVNLYGPTECTTACTGHQVDRASAAGDNVPIGLPLAGAQVHLLDDRLRPVPDGEVGELYVCGAGVARGYLGQPELTAAQFRPDPFCPGGRPMYGTGDLARRRDDGLLEFRGRIDDQVKIRGYRVEPREVERALLRNEAVRDAAVLVAGDDDRRHLVALVVLGDDTSLARIRQHLRDILPDYLTPAAMLAVDRIPATDHSKRDMAALREIVGRELRRRSDFVAPRNDTERYLAKLWEELLPVERVGVTDDFFALGGNSLLAFRMRRRINQELRLDLDMHEVLSATALGELAKLLESTKEVVS